MGQPGEAVVGAERLAVCLTTRYERVLVEVVGGDRRPRRLGQECDVVGQNRPFNDWVSTC